MKEVTAYKTEDGQLFESEFEARAHEAEQVFAQWLATQSECTGMAHPQLIKWLKQARPAIMSLYRTMPALPQQPPNNQTGNDNENPKSINR